MKAIMTSLVLTLTFSISNALAGALEDRYPPMPAKEEYARTAVHLAHLLGGTAMRVANTHSMEPVITSADLLVLKPVALSDLRIGDIIVYRRQFDGGMLIGHRVVSMRARSVETKGDNLWKKDDDLVTQTMLVGRVELVVNGQTGEIRDMLASHEGEFVSMETLELRHGGTPALPDSGFRDSPVVSAGP